MSDLFIIILRGVLVPVVIPLNILFDTSSYPPLFLFFSFPIIFSISTAVVGGHEHCFWVLRYFVQVATYVPFTFWYAIGISLTYIGKEFTEGFGDLTGICCFDIVYLQTFYHAFLAFFLSYYGIDSFPYFSCVILNPYCAVCNYSAFSLFTHKCRYISVSLFLCTTLQWHQIAHSYRFPPHPFQPNCNFSASANMPISCMPHASIDTVLW